MHTPMKLAVAALCALAATTPARAQVASSPPPPESTPGWSFAVTPYLWMPTISAKLQYNTPRGGTVGTTVSAGIGDYLTDINAGVMLGGVARYDRFSVLTDLIYLNLSLTSSTTHIGTVNLGPGPIDVPRTLQLHTGTRFSATIWSLAGAYTLLAGDWGNLDAVAGLRMMGMSSTTNYLLSADVLAPDGTVALSRNGGLNVAKTYVEGIGGVTGRINIPNSKFYLPFYLDAGGGTLPFTWQAYAGIAYRAASWADVSLGYRYLAFQTGNSTGVRNLAMGGVIIAGNFRF
jgi:opacity protein-like surface antigen